jgi:Dolichol phosphate-mannose biosynthesis regulatory protein (DPM2)
MSARVLGVLCVAFSAAVFVYFSAWTFAVPFLPSIRSAFPPRAVLLALPYIGIVGLCAGVTAFIQVIGLRAVAEKK